MTRPVAKRPAWSSVGRAVIAGLSLTLGLCLGGVVVSLPPHSAGLTVRVQTELGQSGVDNPVTAVLLNFRGYDTLLEIAVLLLAVLGVWSLPHSPVASKRSSQMPVSPVLIAFARVLLPLIVIVAAYVLWLGAFAPGGAFQAGAVLAAGGLLLFLSGTAPFTRLSGWPVRMMLVLGFAVFLAVAGGGMATGNRLLEYPDGWAGSLILFIESSLTLSIACILVLLFLGAPPSQLSQSLPGEKTAEDKR